jgi:hypothetical protein
MLFMNTQFYLKNPNSSPFKNWISVGKYLEIQRKNMPYYGDLYHYAGNNPVRYVDPDGKWFFFDDMLYSSLCILLGNQDVSWWQGTLDSFIHSWKHPIDHAKNCYELYKLFFIWSDNKFGLEDFTRWHMKPSTDTEFGVEVDWFDAELTFFIKRKKKKTAQLPELDLSKIQGEVKIDDAND